MNQALIGACAVFAVTVSSTVPSCLVPSVSVEYRDSRAHVFAAEERQVIDRIAQGAVADTRRQLPQLPRPVVVMVQTAAANHADTGDSAIARLPNVIWWDVAPSASGGVRAVAERDLRAALIHQLCHLVRERIQPEHSRLDHAIAEGIASVFEQALTSRAPTWLGSPDGAATLAAEAVRLNGDAAWDTWMASERVGGEWAGPRAGYAIVEAAVRRSGKTVGQLVGLPTQAIVDLSALEHPSSR